MNREPIYAALFATVSAVTGFATVSRKFKIYTEVSPADQPALFQIQKGETAIYTRGTPTKWTARVDLVLYANTSNNPDNAPSVALNGLLDAVEAALAPDVSGVQTLGGLCSHCAIVGQIEIIEGVLGEQAAAIIPIEIITNA